MVVDALEFGQLVRQRRRKLRMTQRDLALVVNSGERFIVELEAGKPTCQLGKALATAKALGIELVPQCSPEKRDLDPDIPDVPGWAP